MSEREQKINEIEEGIMDCKFSLRTKIRWLIAQVRELEATAEQCDNFGTVTLPGATVADIVGRNILEDRIRKLEKIVEDKYDHSHVDAMQFIINGLEAKLTRLNEMSKDIHPSCSCGMG